MKKARIIGNRLVIILLLLLILSCFSSCGVDRLVENSSSENASQSSMTIESARDNSFGTVSGMPELEPLSDDIQKSN